MTTFFLSGVLPLREFVLGFREASYSPAPKIPLQMNVWDVIRLNPVFRSLSADEMKLRSGKN